MSCCGPSGWGTVGMIVTIVGAILAATFNNIVAKIMNEVFLNFNLDFI